MRYSGILIILFLFILFQISAQHPDAHFNENRLEKNQHNHAVDLWALNALALGKIKTLPRSGNWKTDKEHFPEVLSEAAEKIRKRPSPLFVDYPVAYSSNYPKAQAKTTRLKGTIKSPSFTSVAVKFYKDLISFEEKEFVLPLNGGNYFDFQFQIAEPTIAKLAYGNKEVEIFLEPGDDLEIDAHGNEFVWSMGFKGEGAINNNFLKRFNAEFINHGENRVYSEIVSKRAMDYRSYVDRVHRSKWNYYHTYDRQARKKFSNEFERYIIGEIDYWWAYSLLRYHWEHPASNGLSYPMRITPSYYNFLGKILVSNDFAVRSRNYLNFLVLYLKLREDNPDASILEQIDQSVFEVRVSELDVLVNTGSRTPLTTLKRGERIKYLDEKSSTLMSKTIDGIIKSAHWLRVRTRDGREGWVFGGGGEIIGGRQTEKKYKTVEVLENYDKMVAVALVDKLRVRENPDLSNAIALMKQGDEMSYLGNKSSQKYTFNIRGKSRTDHFYNIRTSSGMIGWVFGAGVELKTIKSSRKVKKTITVEGEKKKADPSELYLSGRALYYTMANSLFWKCKNSRPAEVENEVRSFVARCPYPELDEAINKVYQQSLRGELDQVLTIVPPTQPTSVNSASENADIVSVVPGKEEKIKEPLPEKPITKETISTDGQSVEKKKIEKEQPDKSKKNNTAKKQKNKSEKPEKSTKEKTSKSDSENVTTSKEKEKKKPREKPKGKSEDKKKEVKIEEGTLVKLDDDGTIGRVVAEPEDISSRSSGALDEDLVAELDLISLGYTPEEAKKVVQKRKKQAKAEAKKKEKADASKKEEPPVVNNTSKPKTEEKNNWKKISTPPVKTTSSQEDGRLISPAELLSMIDMEPIKREMYSVKVKGKIRYYRNKNVQIILYTDPVSMKEVNFNLFVKPDGAFSTVLKIYEPTIGKFIYGSRHVDIYLEPGDDLDISFFANDFKGTLKYNGKGSVHNSFILDMRREFKNGDVETKGKIYSASAAGFKHFIRKIHKDKTKYYQKNKKGFSSGFDNFIRSDIDYWYAYNLTNYRWENPLQYGNSKPIKITDVSYYDYVDEIGLVNDRALPNEFYTYFLDLYLKDKEEEFENRGMTSMELSTRYLYGEVMYYYQAKRLSALARNGKLGDVIFEIKRFMDECPYETYRESVKAALRESNTLLKGMTAPNFTLLDNNGRKVSLTDFKGKVIYLDFWATWCNACIRQMSNSDNLRNSFKNKDVVFIYVSLDYTESEWKNYLVRHKLPGTHLYAKGGLGSDMAKDYGVKKLPALLIIDKKGRVARNTEKSSNMSVIEQINNLLAIP